MGPVSRFNYVITGENISACVPCDLSRQPVSLCVRTNEYEQSTAVASARFCTSPNAYADRGQVGIAVGTDYFRLQLHSDIRLAAKLVDKVARHALFQRIASHNERNHARMIGSVVTLGVNAHDT